jgi:3-hydroxyisobutyrate dehydrogenase-like beta-hydroxyacid dehydrogenase
MTTTESVSVIGLGQMGAALARSILATGRTLTVWNRTANRCEPLRESGASVAGSPAQAAARGEAILVCVLDYDAANAILRRPDVQTALRGKTLVQLSTGTAADARDGQAWAAAAGIDYVDGAIFGPPGEAGCRIFCSGPANAFERCRAMLAGPEGEALHVGENIADANTLDEAVLIAYEGILFSFLQAAAFCDAEGLPLDRFESMATWLHDRYGPHVGDAVAAVRDRAYPVSVETPLSIWTAAIAQHVRFAREAGIDGSFAEVLLRVARKAIDAGLGDREFSAAYEGFRMP